MTIDTLTIAGFMSAASFMLMPMLMKREFIRVETLAANRVDHQPSLLRSSQGRSATDFCPEQTC